MIGDTIYVYCCPLQLAHNSAEICDYVIAAIIAKIWESILCAEDDMREQVCVGMPHA